MLRFAQQDKQNSPPALGGKHGGPLVLTLGQVSQVLLRTISKIYVRERTRFGVYVVLLCRMAPCFGLFSGES